MSSSKLSEKFKSKYHVAIHRASFTNIDYVNNIGVYGMNKQLYQYKTVERK